MTIRRAVLLLLLSSLAFASAWAYDPDRPLIPTVPGPDPNEPVWLTQAGHSQKGPVDLPKPLPIILPHASPQAASASLKTGGASGVNMGTVFAGSKFGGPIGQAQKTDKNIKDLIKKLG